MQEKTITVGTVSVTVRGPADVVDAARPEVSFWPEDVDEFRAILDSCGGVDEFLPPSEHAIRSKSGNGAMNTIVIYAPDGPEIQRMPPSLLAVRDAQRSGAAW